MTKKSVTHPVCEIEGCLNRGDRGSLTMCTKHWTRWTRHADPFWGDKKLIVKAVGDTLEERFWSKVDKTPGQGPNGECWEWKGAPSHRYGSFTYKGNRYAAHRFAYELVYGAMDKDLFACHKCDNTRCVRPDHIFPGTALENMQDKDAKGRGNYTGPYKPNKGERINTAKLTADDVKYVREVYNKAESKYGLLGELARSLDVTRHTIFKAIHGHNWKHIQ